ncbi:MAG TPA: hypothetical protein VMN58_12355 [Acidimicrobiales bacterium]|nr:hypothetical protein [Acidimicrobiales bacterium]
MNRVQRTTTRAGGLRARVGVALTGLAAIALLAAPMANADPIDSGSAAGFGAEIMLSDTDVTREPVAEVTAVAGDDESTVIDIPADPLAVSGTLTARANVHVESDIESGLTVNDHTVEGPYNARGLGEIENAQVLMDAAGEDVPLLSAALIRAEAVAVCTADTVQYSANSELVDLQIGGEAVPLDSPLSDIIDGISTVLAESGLDVLVNVERNVIAETEGGGIEVDALVVTVLSAVGDVPLGQVTLAHGEVGPITCAAAPAAELPQQFEPEETRALPATGGSAASLLGAGLLAAALGGLALRRRFAA